MLRQNMNASSHEKANCFPPSRNTPKLTPRPINANTPPAPIKIVGTLRHLDKSSGCSLAGLLLILLFQISALIRRKVVHRPEMAQLQGAQVGDDRPAVFHRHIWPVSTHRIATVRD